MSLKRTYLLILLAALGGAVRAQISPLADQFLINSFLTNPAFAGTEAKAPLNIAARQQWLGIKGAPSWQSATYHSIIKARTKRFNSRGFVNKGQNSFGNVGVGGGLFNVKYGAIRQTGIHLDYAYHVFTGNGRLSFGLAPMYQQFIIDKSGFIPPDGIGPDPLIDGDVKEILHIFDVNAGVHYYSDFVEVGFSAVQLLNSSVAFGQMSFATDEDSFKNFYLARSFYFYAGIKPAIGKNFILHPSILFKHNAKSGFGAQANLLCTINEIFQAGLLYKYKEAAGLFAGVRVGDLVFRYQFDLPVGTTDLIRFTSHQVMVGYQL